MGSYSLFYKKRKQLNTLNKSFCKNYSLKSSTNSRFYKSAKLKEYLVLLSQRLLAYVKLACLSNSFCKNDSLKGLSCTASAFRQSDCTIPIFFPSDLNEGGIKRVVITVLMTVLCCVRKYKVSAGILFNYELMCHK